MKRKYRRLLNRSGLEKCEICGREGILVQHHIRGRNIPNANHPSNLANICPNCHADIHNGIIILEDWVMTTGGYELLYHHYKEPSLTGNDAKPWIV